MEKSIHVRFDDKLDYEKSKLCEKLTNVTITFTKAKEKIEKDK